MESDIIALKPENFYKCRNIWNFERQADLVKRFYYELTTGNRITYVYQSKGDYIGEISLVFKTNDPDYTVPGKRIYISRLIVKPNKRRYGIGRALINYAVERAREMSYSELSVGVNSDNLPAIKLYADLGFNQLVFTGEDSDGEYIKLLKHI